MVLHSEHTQSLILNCLLFAYLKMIVGVGIRGVGGPQWRWGQGPMNVNIRPCTSVQAYSKVHCEPEFLNEQNSFWKLETQYTLSFLFNPRLGLVDGDPPQCPATNSNISPLTENCLEQHLF